MKVLKIIRTDSKDGSHSLAFGIPDREQEFNEMFNLRYKIYVLEAAYGDKKSFQEEKEQDEYDLQGKCRYFLATLDGKIAGTARLVITDPLPVVKDYFLFEEPLTIRKIPKNRLAEVSRLISRPSEFVFPRHLITLGLFDSMIKHCQDNDILAGYAVIEAPLREKLKELKIPFYLIENFTVKKTSLTQRFPGYFDQSKNKLCLIYFFRDEVAQWLEKIMNNRLIFKRVDGQTIIFKNGFFFKIIKKISKLV